MLLCAIAASLFRRRHHAHPSRRRPRL